MVQGTKLYKWASVRRGKSWYSSPFTTLETAVQRQCYVIATERQNLSEENKIFYSGKMSAIVGMAVGLYLNRTSI